MSDCVLLNPLRRDGTSQRQRIPTGLKPGFVLTDERGTADLLLYAGELARLLRYYNEANEPAGNWAEFIERDVSTLAALVSAYDTAALKEGFDQSRALAAADATAFPGAFAALLAHVFAAAATFERWRRGSAEGSLLRSRLEQQISSVLADALQDAMRYGRRAKELSIPVTLPDPLTFGPRWGDLAVSPDASLFPSNSLTSEERSAAIELVRRAFERFYETIRRVVGEGPAFLEDTLANYPRHQPHAALFLAFLELFGHARESLNVLTSRHLDFYYREVLRLTPRPAIADRVHVIFELAKSFERFRLPQDTALSAGKDATGVPLVFGLDAELVVNRAALDPVHGLKTVLVEPGDGNFVRNVYAAPDADSADGLGAALQGDEPRWSTFGSTAMPYARIGFAIASPMFWLSEGTRTVTVKFSLDSDNFRCGRAVADVQTELKWNVVVQATGEKGWIDLDPVDTQVHLSVGVGPFLEYTIKLPASAGPVVALDPALHGDPLDTRYPVLRFILDNRGLPAELLVWGRPAIPDYSDDIEYNQDELVRFNDRIYQAQKNGIQTRFRPDSHPDEWQLIPYAYAYKYFERMRVRMLNLNVDVRDMRNLILENDLGVVSPAKPFFPFGPTPRIGASFLVGSPEPFQKRLTSLTLKVTWAGYPEAGFYSHYDAYKNNAGQRIVSDNEHFMADIEVLQERKWKSKASDVHLFTPVGGKPNETRDFPTLPFNTVTTDFPRNPATETFNRFVSGLERGFIRLKLKTSFLHEMFAAALAKFAKNGGSAPNPPYTPTLSGLTLDYNATETVDYSSWKREDIEKRVERLFQIGPFGQQEVVPAPASAALPGVVLAHTLVPEFSLNATADSPSGPAEGTLYLGLSALTPPENLALFFQLAEGSEDPSLSAQPVNWSYLTATGWYDFLPAEIVGDTTNRLVVSGIVQFAVPRAATNSATLLPSGLQWLRATVQAKSAAVPKMIAVHAQAGRATFRDHGNDPTRLAVPLPAASIAKLIAREAAIKSVAQPYASFGGRPAESDEALHVRVAERLRHKQRAITIFDYERLVLDRFPDVYKARCINHTDAESEYAPGSVRLVVVPDPRNRNAMDPLRPRLALAKLTAIRQYLEDLACDFASIEVVNPEYEEVRVRFNVRFLPGYDKGFYTGQLEKDIIRFLTPWAFDESRDLAFGGRVHRSAILDFIDEREYVDFVSDFEMDHIIGTKTRRNIEEAEPTRSTAVLASAHGHEIGDDITSCSDAPSPAAPAGGAATSQSPHSPPGPGPGGATGKRYLGNAHTRELHDLQKVTPQCQIDEIPVDRRFFVSRIEDALALGYDYCAYCFGRAASRR